MQPLTTMSDTVGEGHGPIKVRSDACALSPALRRRPPHLLRPRKCAHDALRSAVARARPAQVFDFSRWREFKDHLKADIATVPLGHRHDNEVKRRTLQAAFDVAEDAFVYFSDPSHTKQLAEMKARVVAHKPHHSMTLSPMLPAFLAKAIAVAVTDLDAATFDAALSRTAVAASQRAMRNLLTEAAPKQKKFEAGISAPALERPPGEGKKVTRKEQKAAHSEEEQQKFLAWMQTSDTTHAAILAERTNTAALEDFRTEVTAPVMIGLGQLVDIFCAKKIVNDPPREVLGTAAALDAPAYDHFAQRGVEGAPAAPPPAALPPSVHGAVDGMREDMATEHAATRQHATTEHATTREHATTEHAATREQYREALGVLRERVDKLGVASQSGFAATAAAFDELVQAQSAQAAVTSSGFEQVLAAQSAPPAPNASIAATLSQALSTAAASVAAPVAPVTAPIAAPLDMPVAHDVAVAGPADAPASPILASITNVASRGCNVQKRQREAEASWIESHREVLSARILRPRGEP